MHLSTHGILPVIAIVLAAWFSACTTDAPAPEPKPRTLPEARQIALDLFRELDGFELLKQREVGLAGRPAVRMEAHWKHDGQERQGIIYVVDHPAMFNVILFTAPAEEGMFEAGYPVFQDMLKNLRVIQHSGPLNVVEEKDYKVLRSPELQLAIRYPRDWVYTLDSVNRALVFSGPKTDPSWLSTVSFSVIHKYASPPS
jgi:hypothetical protein